MPVVPSWLLEPLWEQFSALLPARPVYHPAHPLGCHRPRISDRIVFDKLVQVLRFGCSYEAVADRGCPATTIRERRDEWIRAGIFAKLKQIALEAYDRIIGLALQDIAVDGCITKAPGAGRRPLRRPQPGGPRQAGHEKVPADRRVRHPAGPGAGTGQPERLSAAGRRRHPSLNSRRERLKGSDRSPHGHNLTNPWQPENLVTNPND